MFRATLFPSSGADDLVVFFRCGVVSWPCRQSDPVRCLCVHWEVRSTTYKEKLIRRNKYNTKWHLVELLFYIELRCTVNHTSNLVWTFSLTGVSGRSLLNSLAKLMNIWFDLIFNPRQMQCKYFDIHTLTYLKSLPCPFPRVTNRTRISLLFVLWL